MSQRHNPIKASTNIHLHKTKINKIKTSKLGRWEPLKWYHIYYRSHLVHMYIGYTTYTMHRHSSYNIFLYHTQSHPYYINVSWLKYVIYLGYDQESITIISKRIKRFQVDPMWCEAGENLQPPNVCVKLSFSISFRRLCNVSLSSGILSISYQCTLLSWRRCDIQCTKCSQQIWCLVRGSY